LLQTIPFLSVVAVHEHHGTAGVFEEGVVLRVQAQPARQLAFVRRLLPLPTIETAGYFRSPLPGLLILSRILSFALPITRRAAGAPGLGDTRAGV